MKTSYLASLMIVAIVAMSGVVAATNESAVNAEFEMHYMSDADGIAWSAWEGGANASVFSSNVPKNDKKLHTINLVQSLDIQTTIKLIVNKHKENGSWFQSYKISGINYDGTESEVVKQKLQIERTDKMIYQRLIDVETQALLKEIVYDVKKNKSRVYEMVEGEWTQTGHHTGYATLSVHTEDGVLVTEVVPPMMN